MSKINNEITEERVQKLYEVCVENKDNIQVLKKIKNDILKKVKIPDIFLDKNPKKLTEHEKSALTVAATLDLYEKYGQDNKIKAILDNVIPALQSNDLEQLLKVEKQVDEFKKRHPNHSFVEDFRGESLLTGKSLIAYNPAKTINKQILEQSSKKLDIDTFLKVAPALDDFVERRNKDSFKKITFTFDAKQIEKDIEKKVQSLDSKVSQQDITESMINLHNATPFLEKKGVDVENAMTALDKLRGELVAPDILQKYSPTEIAKLIESESQKLDAKGGNLDPKATCRAVLSSIPYESWDKMAEVSHILTKREKARGSFVGRVSQNFSDAITNFVAAVQSIGNSTKNQELKTLSESFSKSLKENNPKTKSELSQALKDQAKGIVKNKNIKVQGVSNNVPNYKNNSQVKSSDVGRS
jgi:hypothetical protein